MFSSLNSKEREKFDDLSEKWWDEDGPFKHLHIMNQLRVSYIKNILFNNNKTLQNSRCLDVGCGGGILSFSLEKLGANVTAIDASSPTIKKASSINELKGSNVLFKVSTIEELVEEQFDIVCCMEVIEHIDNVYCFLHELEKNTKTDGFIFISTINRNVISYLKAIVVAEYMLRFVPIGTHSWKKFIKPSEIVDGLNSCKPIDITGMKFSPISKNWEFSSDISTNYIAAFKKNNLLNL
ncbi:putative PrmA superfamily methyltransferase [Candidatus Cyrtobacter comes]|uniref:Ubiquinone biosynthesis O-methyltransferase n=1 Tax=Candidatus Cyrtobacter comes TaxID=675776 RepID=A0ABU5L6K8_9RICK|nr:bifunctional 2-polyprenyl-6-hydroxyphenol methylase/3-demethylubiquinol 3-O-methyltransferase UbiG [Candidatus Cyrtobacter comes]MDZ5761753.1 putative PrmA superfamily methyltransferase [Candidatus Cyrtobacter comes]